LGTAAIRFALARVKSFGAPVGLHFTPLRFEAFPILIGLSEVLELMRRFAEA
jgi:hypothetical protein